MELYLEFTMGKKKKTLLIRRVILWQANIHLWHYISTHFYGYWLPYKYWKHFSDFTEITWHPWSRLRVLDHYMFVIGISTGALFLLHAYHQPTGEFETSRWDLMDIIPMPLFLLVLLGRFSLKGNMALMQWLSRMWWEQSVWMTTVTLSSCMIIWWIETLRHQCQNEKT